MASADNPEIGILPSGTRTWFRVLAFITVISVGGLVVLGGVVRVTESGLGCPDWPLCYGGFLPPPDLKAIIEYSHRFVASALVGPLVLATCIAAWIAYRKQPWLVVPASVALVLLFIQSGLGAVTVLQELPPFIVLVHLAVAQAMLATLIVLLVVSFAGPLTSAAPLVGAGPLAGAAPLGGPNTPESDTRSRRLPSMLLAASVMAYALILTGSYVTAAGATAACVGWPLCHGSLFPDSWPQTVHMGHRYATLVFGLFMIYALHLAIKSDRGGSIRWLGLAGSAALLTQIAAGAFVVTLGFTEELRALHLSLATIVWGIMVGLTAAAHTRLEDHGRVDRSNPRPA